MKIPLFWQIIIEESVNLKTVLRTLIKLNYCVNTNNIFQSQKWFAKSRKLSCKSQKKFYMVLVPAVSQYQMAVYILCLLQGYLWRPIIFCFKSNEKFQINHLVQHWQHTRMEHSLCSSLVKSLSSYLTCKLDRGCKSQAIVLKGKTNNALPLPVFIWQ